MATLLCQIAQGLHEVSGLPAVQRQTSPWLGEALCFIPANITGRTTPWSSIAADSCDSMDEILMSFLNKTMQHVTGVEEPRQLRHCSG